MTVVAAIVASLAAVAGLAAFLLVPDPADGRRRPTKEPDPEESGDA